MRYSETPASAVRRETKAQAAATTHYFGMKKLGEKVKYYIHAQVFFLSLVFSPYLSPSLPPSLLHVSLCLSLSVSQLHLSLILRLSLSLSLNLSLSHSLTLTLTHSLSSLCSGLIRYLPN